MMKKVVIFDMILNLTLGILFTLFPTNLMQVIFINKSSLSPILVALVGLGLFGFGIWQFYILKKGLLNTQTIKFLGALAIAPALILSGYVIFYSYTASTSGFIIMVVGDIYMYILSIFYFMNVQNK